MSKPLIAAFVLLSIPYLAGQNPADPRPPGEADRLLATGKLWITVKYFHPYLAYRDIDWDQALIAALPKIRAAQTVEDYKAAVESMLEKLSDPETRVLSEEEGLRASAQTSADGQRSWVHNGLPPETGNASTSYYSAFFTRKASGSQIATVPMNGFTAAVRLSEPAAGNAPMVPNPAAQRAYPGAYPATEYRILAAYKIWGVFHYFFAYRDLMDEDWDDLLPVFLQRFIAANDAREYNLAVAELLTHTADSQTQAQSEMLAAYFGQAPPGLRLRLIEKHAVVTEVCDPNATKAGIRPGDIVKQVDGETLVDKFKREAQYVGASTPQSLGYQIMQRILDGPDGSVAALSIEDRNGNRKDVSLKRSLRYSELLMKERSDGAVRVLPGSIGYADLDRLQTADIDGMFEKLRDTKSLVFDLRGSAAGEALARLAPRLTDQRDVPTAIFTGPVTMAPDIQQSEMSSQSSSYFFVQTLPNSSQWKYKGKTVMLIDERTIGPAEHAGLLLESASRTESVGSPSAGADSEVTNFTVPGGVTIYFSGCDIRHANGGKLQRLGLQPNVLASPTLEGIRAGRDELLEKAIEYLSPDRKVAALH